MSPGAVVSPTRVRAVVHVVAVEAQRSLEAGGVPRSKPGGEHPLAGSVFQNRVPDLTDQIGRHEDLEAILSRVPGARHECAHACDLTRRKPKYGRSSRPFAGKSS